MPAHVFAPTSSVIIVSPGDPYLVAVGDSRTHAKPVIVGGKCDKGEDPRTTAERETIEERGVPLVLMRPFGVAWDSTRDVRSIPCGKLFPCVTYPEDALSGMSADDTVLAAHGCPDHLYVGLLAPQEAGETDQELTNIRYLDVRGMQPGDLSAGHDVFLFWWYWALKNSAAEVDDRGAVCEQEATGSSLTFQIPEWWWSAGRGGLPNWALHNLEFDMNFLRRALSL